MRVTQSMLSGNNLKYISQNYSRLAKLQEQVQSGKKITKPSDDPVVAMKGMRYRTQLVEVNQFRRNLNEGFNWMDNADAALDETTQVLQRIRELTVQASNDSNNAESRKNIAEEIGQLQQHIYALANTKVGENYIFNGTDTAAAPITESKINSDVPQFLSNVTATTPPATFDQNNYVISYRGQTFSYNSTDDVFQTTSGEKLEISTDADGNNVVHHTYKTVIAEKEIEMTEEISTAELVVTAVDAGSTNNQSVKMEVMKGIQITINVNSQGAFSKEMLGGLESIKKMLMNPDVKGSDITKALDSIDSFKNGIISTQAELGAIVNRAEMIDSRLLEQKEIATSTISNNEDIELEEAIINLTIQESLHRASLAVGARIIQPSLMDFLR